jgi:dTDP-4-dehydrorhamnose 3,5-epimerase
MDALTPLLNGIHITPLKRISNPKGDIYHALNGKDADFSSFGEAYFTTIIHGETKGWKRHQRMVMNLIVPEGEVLFHFHDEVLGMTKTIALGTRQYARLCVQPGLWMAFTGLGSGLNLILNVASIAHDPSESDSADLCRFPLSETP